MTDCRQSHGDEAAGILVLTESGEILRADERASKLLGAGSQEIEGAHFSRFLCGKYDFGEIRDLIANEGGSAATVIRLTDAEGNPVDARLSALELRCTCKGNAHIICALQTGGDPGHVAGEAHASIVESEHLADLLPEIVFEMNLAGTLTFVNQKGYELTGYTPEDFERGLMALDVLSPDDHQKAIRNILAILAGKGEGPHEYTALRKDGTAFPVLIHSAPVFRDGEPAGLRGVMIDMTEQKRAETDLRIVDSAMACSINGIAIADMEGRLTYVNAAFLRIWGYDSQEEVMRRSALEFWEMADKAKEVITALNLDGGWIGELVGKRRDGSTFDVETAATLVTDESGRPIRMMASFIDITDRKRVEHEREQDLVRREKLRGALEMAGAACHEFNQPMQIISGYAELLLRDRRGSGLGCEELRRIKAASDRMIEISRKIQQITRYETREYVGGATIIDIDKSSCPTGPEEPRS